MRLVNDNQIPMRLPQSGQNFGALGEIKRSNDLLVFHPLVDAELVANVAAFKHEELFVELSLELALPLKQQIGRTDDKNAFDKAAQFELSDEKAGHDGLACTGVIGQQETHAGQFEQVLVDRFKLVRQRVYARDGKPKIGIEFVGDA